jgi:ankyrin repeat protein
MSGIFNAIEQASHDKSKLKLLHDYIVQNPNELLDVQYGMPVYAYAAISSFAVLKTVHAAYLSLSVKFERKPYKVRGDYGFTALHFAVQYNLNTQVKYLIEEVGIDPNVSDFMKNTPLHLCCIYKRLQIFKMLVYEHGVNVDLLNSNNETPLLLAAVTGQTEMARILLQKGARTSFKIAQYKMPIVKIDLYSLVKKHGTQEMVLLFTEYARKQISKNKSKRKVQKQRDLIRMYQQEYEFVCSQLEDESNETLVSELAAKLKIDTSMFHKRDICRKISNRLHLYLRSPRVFEI